MIVRPGDGLSGGNVRVADADSNTVILVASDSISTAAVMNTEGIDAGTNTIEATQLTGGTVTATLGDDTLRLTDVLMLKWPCRSSPPQLELSNPAHLFVRADASTAAV